MRNRTGPSDAELLGEERDRRMSSEAAIARVRERCDYLPGYVAEIILRALDGGTE